MQQRRPRVRDPKYLEFLRKKPCCLCGNERSDACHIRSGNLEIEKPPTGMAEKPDDMWGVPMCRSCHGQQHSMNEMDFWRARGIDPFALSQRYYAEYRRGNPGKTTMTKPRSRTTIAPRGFPKTQRKLKSRSSFR